MHARPGWGGGRIEDARGSFRNRGQLSVLLLGLVVRHTEERRERLMMERVQTRLPVSSLPQAPDPFNSQLWLQKGGNRGFGNARLVHRVSGRRSQT
jgi:hypothetical protein